MIVILNTRGMKESRIAATTSSRCLRPKKNKKRNNYDCRGNRSLARHRITKSSFLSYWAEGKAQEQEKINKRQFVICDLNFTVCIFSASLAFFAGLEARVV